MRIRAVFATRAPREGADARVLHVVAGSATFAERRTGDAAEHSAAQERGQMFAGYLVDLAL